MTSLPDRTHPDSIIQRLIDALVVALGGLSVRVGSGSATWTAAILSAPVVIPHGLDAAPKYANAQTQSQLFDFKVTADATNLTVTGYRTDNTPQSGTINFYWVAIG